MTSSRLIGVFALLAGGFASGGCQADADKDCPVGECTPGTATCHGTVRHSCDAAGFSTDNPDLVCSPQGHWSVDDCAVTPGAACVDGDCVLAVERCPPNSKRTCVDNQNLRCSGDRVEVPGQDCSAAGKYCVELVAPDGTRNSACAASPIPCVAPKAYTCLADGSAEATCFEGYPDTVTPCAAGELCTDPDPTDAFGWPTCMPVP